MFTDQARVTIKSGKGGDGHVSFRRESYVPAGGPDGGDGGRGGDIIFEVDPGMNTLTDFRHVRKYVAESGKDGQNRKKHGADGKDLVIKVPEGTIIREQKSGKIVADMSGDNKRVTVLKGGRGGRGNMHYATSVMQAPRYAKPGKPAQELEVSLELKLIADVGLIGYPSVGKSTLLARTTHAEPKIAAYHFTTLEPNLGVVDLPDGRGFVMADIPGIMEGASKGVGLGHEFLRHIERTKVLIHVVDAAALEDRDPVEDIRLINEELAAYDEDLLSRPQIIAANKIDAVSPDIPDPVKRIREAFEPEKIPVYPISAVTGQGVNELLYAVADLLATLPKETTVYAPEFSYEADLDSDLPFTVTKEEEGLYSVEGPRVEKMLGYTNLESEKGFLFFQKFMKETGILQELKDAGIQEKDTVDVCGWTFEYYDEEE